MAGRWLPKRITGGPNINDLGTGARTKFNRIMESPAAETVSFFLRRPIDRHFRFTI